MAELETYLAILFKFLAASLVIERILEFSDKVFSLFGLAAGNSNILRGLAGLVPEEQSEQRRIIRKMLIMQSIAITAGIIVCYSSQLGVLREFGLVRGLHVWDIILSGFLISGGTEPIHSLINFLQNSKDKLKADRAGLQE